MKKIFISTFFLMLFLDSSAQNKSLSILGEWKEIEYQGNDGANDYITKTENGETLVFEEYQVIKDGLGNFGTFKISGDSLHIILGNKDRFYRIFLNNKKLELTPVTSKYEIICDEGCAHIYIKPEKSLINIQEQNIISGRITSKKDNIGMVGVIIKNKTKNVSTGTDYYGQFVIRASKNDEIVISYPNMQTIKFKVIDKKNYDIFLEEYVNK